MKLIFFNKTFYFVKGTLSREPDICPTGADETERIHHRPLRAQPITLLYRRVCTPEMVHPSLRSKRPARFIARTEDPSTTSPNQSSIHTKKISLQKIPRKWEHWISSRRRIQGSKSELLDPPARFAAKAVHFYQESSQKCSTFCPHN